ncbi:protein bfr2-like [Selaginella moellendorffii]|uniref:protein bfr2-like n=1 Tax=Selaginella moellendorffii TaxID=88036 RepID=UPI000D1D103A|nr:protein bfr2-like [Selaginella moellendorffii]|eukprot:XP_024538306.1 protein bfr2-like [Selaginella moellendorffii]
MPAKAKAKAVASDSDEDSWDDEEAGFGQETQHLLQEQSSDGPDEVETFSKSDGRLRLRPDISLEGKEYSGRKSSRKNAFDGISDDDFHDRDDLQPAFSEEEDDDEKQVEKNVLDDDFEAVNKEYEDLNKEEQEMLKSLRGQNDVDIRKGRAVKNQMELWGSALHMRIALQKIVAGSNLLPQEEASSPSEAQQTLKAAALQTLDSLLDLEKALLEQNREALDAYRKDSDVEQETHSVSDSLDSAWQRLSNSYSRLIPYRDRTVDRWHRKTQISSGAAASRSKLKAFNQSISQQVAAAMKDTPRFIARMMRSEPLKTQTDTNDMEAKTNETKVFDDSEFYQQLLREFLESSNPTGLDHDAVRKLRSKKRKNVDRRASKGRKTRYTVHEPLVNFMVPEPMVLPPMATKLFTSLFGSKPATSAVNLEAAA